MATLCLTKEGGIAKQKLECEVLQDLSLSDPSFIGILFLCILFGVEVLRC